MSVVLDANALLLPFQFKINLDLELQRLVGTVEIYVPSCTVGEVRRLAKKRWEAQAAEQLMEKYKIIEVESLGDDGVIEAGKKLNAYVVTNDRKLIERLVKEGIRVITLKNGHLVIEYD